MPRYDEGYGRTSGYDPRAAREAYTEGGFGPPFQQRVLRHGNGGGYGHGRGGPRYDPANAYDGDFRPHRGWGGAMEDDESHDDRGGGALYGPARYGLGPYYRRLHQRTRPDDELKADVEEALFYDTWVDAEAITVEVSGGVVTLRGDLPDHDEVRFATDDAWDVEGVRGVRSELRVDPGKRKPIDGLDRRNDRAESSRVGNS
ncbi:MAG TPA: BON domain-containing protein [Longimicrobium sp.]|nr:BON domain-containing protein [Longimicrobium sp.]